MSLDRILLLIPFLPLTIVTLMALLLFKRMKKELRLFSLFLFLSAVIQYLSLFLYEVRINNMPLLHLYTLLGGIILIIFYRELFAAFLPKSILNSIVIFFGMVVLIDSCFIESIYAFNSYTLTFEATILSCLSLTYFSISMRKSKELDRRPKVENWLNSGIFIYFTSNLLLYFFGAHLIKALKGSLFIEVWMIHSLITFLSFSFFLIGIWKSRDISSSN